MALLMNSLYRWSLLLRDLDSSNSMRASMKQVLCKEPTIATLMGISNIDVDVKGSMNRTEGIRYVRGRGGLLYKRSSADGKYYVRCVKRRCPEAGVYKYACGSKSREAERGPDRHWGRRRRGYVLGRGCEDKRLHPVVNGPVGGIDVGDSSDQG